MLLTRLPQVTKYKQEESMRIEEAGLPLDKTVGVQSFTRCVHLAAHPAKASLPHRTGWPARVRLPAQAMTPLFACLQLPRRQAASPNASLACLPC